MAPCVVFSGTPTAHSTLLSVMSHLFSLVKLYVIMYQLTSERGPKPAFSRRNQPQKPERLLVIRIPRVFAPKERPCGLKSLRSGPSLARGNGMAWPVRGTGNRGEAESPVRTLPRLPCLHPWECFEDG